MTPPGIRGAGDTNVGKVRTANEDALIVEPEHGLYAVLDGMGGANAGDVAARTAREAFRELVLRHRLAMTPRALLEAAIQHASATVFAAAQQARERHGMGTTVVACLVVDPRRVVIAHVGDSRAYLLRDGRVQILTRDHTIVEELVAQGQLSAEEAERHPYKNVLSRNLGAKPDTRVDILELALEPGDRLMLCSDGLYGYASVEAIQYLLGSGDAPAHVARDLIDLALRGGGGDNVTAIVIEAPPSPLPATEVVRTTGAIQWWQQRGRFFEIARERGLPRNPIVRGLDPDEAMELVASSLCEAIFHDLEKSTGVNAWTFAQNLAGGWFARSGEWAPLRALMDILASAAHGVVDDIGAADAKLGFLLSIAVSRAFVVAELAIGGLLAERSNRVDAELIELHAALADATDRETALEDPGDPFVDRPTVRFLRPDRVLTNPGINAELIAAIAKTITIARSRTAPREERIPQILDALEAIAIDATESFASAVLAAREIYGARAVDDTGVARLFDAFDQTRILTAASVRQITATDAMRAKVLRVLSSAHQRLVGATTGLVLEAVAPVSDRLREVQTRTAELRDEVATIERERAALEREHVTAIDHARPWEHHGGTEW